MVQSDRFVLTSRGARRDRLHGAWWPASTDVVLELRAMLTAAASDLGKIQGVTLNRDEWPGAPLVVQALTSRSPVVSWYGLIEPHLAVLHTGTARISLLLVDPETPADVALTAMRLASAQGNQRSAPEVMSAAYAKPGPEDA